MQVPEIRAGAIVDGNYRLERPIGEGGIGTVWLAWQERVQRRVAIKFLKGEHALDQRERFLVEARALGRLNHPNCITIYDFGYDETYEALYLVMEHLDGTPLSEWRGRRIPVADSVEIARQVASALANAHHQSVFHRDLKPENVFLVKTYDEQTLVKVLDFGLARLGEAPGERLTQSGEVFGTPAYMSPEQIHGTRHAGAASDIYSLGVMLYEMIERRLPFGEMSPFEIMMAHVGSPVPPMRRQIPEELARIIYRCLEKEPEKRFPDTVELYRALGALELPPEEEMVPSRVEAGPLESTLDGPPPAVWDPADFESTLEDEEKKETLLFQKTDPLPFRDEPPPADRPLQSSHPVQLQSQRTLTAVSGETESPSKGLRIGVAAVVVALLLVTVILILVL